jgi:hypothetical protein
MTLNVAQYLAPLNSAQVLAGYTQGVKQGTGVSIAPDGTISLNPAGAASLGFLTSSITPAPVYAWPAGSGNPGAILTSDGAGNLTWDTNYVQTFPLGQNFPHTGAAAIPAGNTAGRPASPIGSLRYNTDFNYLEFFNGTTWIPVSPPSGPVFSFVQGATPTANNAGDLWLDINTNQEKVWDGVSWVPTTPLANAITPGRVKIGTNVQIAVDGTISILPTTGVSGSVSNAGVTTITDNVTSLSIDSALSANQGRLLQNQINALLIANNLTLAGIISGAGVMTYVTPAGALQGFVLGAPLPVASVSNEDYFVIIENAGGFTPPGGAFTVVTQGDWFLSSLNTWQFLNVGYDAPYATDTVPGIIEIATQAETNAGLDFTRAVTPLTLAGYISAGGITAANITVSPAINGNTNVQSALADAVYDITSTGLTVTVTSTPTGLFNVEVTQATETQLGGAQIATDVETQALALDTVIVTPLKLGNLLSSGAINANDILLSPLINGKTNVQAALSDAIYNISSSNNSATVVETAVGQVDLTVTQATETQLGGAQIATQAETNVGTDDTVIVTPLKLSGRAATETLTGIAEIATQAETETGADDTRIVTPLKLRTAAVYKSDFNAKGDLLSATANDTPTILPVGTDGQVLVADSTTVSGLKWSTAGAVTFVNLDDVSAGFDGLATSFPLTIGTVPYTPSPSTNIMVFVGGVAQVPGAGNAYIVVGSNISFTSAPPAGATFYATTVK